MCPSSFQEDHDRSDITNTRFLCLELRVRLDGKRNDWKAVVLLPFVDEARLFEAMASVNLSELTVLEKKRNT